VHISHFVLELREVFPGLSCRAREHHVQVVGYRFDRSQRLPQLIGEASHDRGGIV
jgi:hypothetical protein